LTIFQIRLHNGLTILPADGHVRTIIWLVYATILKMKMYYRFLLKYKKIEWEDLNHYTPKSIKTSAIHNSSRYEARIMVPRIPQIQNLQSQRCSERGWEGAGADLELLAM